MSCIPSQCTAQSTGAGGRVFLSLIQTLIAAQCSISPREMWPPDYAEPWTSGNITISSIMFHANGK